MNVEETLKQLRDYYVDELLKGNWEALNVDEYVVNVLTYSGARFSLWHKGEPDGFECYRGDLNTIHLDFNQSQKDALWILCRNVWNQHQKDLVNQ